MNQMWSNKDHIVILAVAFSMCVFVVIVGCLWIVNCQKCLRYDTRHVHNRTPLPNNLNANTFLCVCVSFLLLLLFCGGGGRKRIAFLCLLDLWGGFNACVICRIIIFSGSGIVVGGGLCIFCTFCIFICFFCIFRLGFLFIGL